MKAAIKQGLQVQPGFDMLTLQTPLFLDSFGLEQVADYLRADDSAAREMLFPRELLSLVNG